MIECSRVEVLERIQELKTRGDLDPTLDLEEIPDGCIECLMKHGDSKTCWDAKPCTEDCAPFEPCDHCQDPTNASLRVEEI